MIFDSAEVVPAALSLCKFDKRETRVSCRVWSTSQICSSCQFFVPRRFAHSLNHHHHQFRETDPDLLLSIILLTNQSCSLDKKSLLRRLLSRRQNGGNCVQGKPSLSLSPSSTRTTINAKGAKMLTCASAEHVRGARYATAGPIDIASTMREISD